MATIERAPLIPARVPRERRGRGRARQRRLRMSPTAIESGAIFLLFLIAYGALGWRVVHDQHLIIFDATARLAHAYFVLWNDPAKLASIGFVWAPFSTLVFLPFALIKPLATSLMALTATSAVSAAFTMAVVARTMTFLGMPRWQRLPLIVAFGLNPMVLYYAVNGMSEMPYLALLSASIYYFVRWHVDERAVWLVPCGIIMAIAVLTRYEIAGYAAVICLAVPVSLVMKRRHHEEVVGSTIAVVTPLVYSVGLWIFFNWLIIGDPLFWLQNQIGIGGSGETEAPAAAQSVAAINAAAAPAPTRGALFQQLLHLNEQLFPLVLVMIPALLIATAVGVSGRVKRVTRRDAVMSFWMAVLVGTNLLTTGLLLLKSPDVNLMQLRYNMRSLPVAVIALAWLWYVVGAKRPRVAVWAVGLAILVGTIPLTWHVMRSWPQQYEENIFVKALSTGQDQEGTDPGGPYTVGNADDREMANWITANVPAVRNSVLTDDGQTFGVMLANGHPDLFRDRIDQGDESWKRVLNRPWGKVDYLLVARYPLPPSDLVDEIETRYPGLRTGDIPGISVEHANPHYVLLRVARHKPRSAPSRFDKALDDAQGSIVPHL